MAEIAAKFVRTLAPGGATLNYTGITGNSHKAVAMPLSLIKKGLERGVKFYELIEEKDDDGNVTGYSEVELTLENYDSDNGGKAVEATNNVVPDVEEERKTIHDQEYADRLAEKGLEIKKRQEALAASVLGEDSEDSDQIIDGGDEDSTTTGGSGTQTIDGGDEDDLDDPLG